MSYPKLSLIFMLYAIAGAVKLSTDRCGSGYGKCDSGYCCSKYNWCGTSSDHCGSGCQSSYGKCGTSSSTSTSTSTSTSNSRKIQYVGFRFSEGGVKDNYGSIPKGEQWVSYVNKFKTKSTLVPKES